MLGPGPDDLAACLGAPRNGEDAAETLPNMTGHRFKVGEAVTAHAPGFPPGPYVIVRVLPLVGNEPHYQGKDGDGVVRALLESQIRAVPVRSAAEEAEKAPPLQARQPIKMLGRQR